MIDLRQGRRNKFITCIYWSKITDPNIAKYSELSYENQATGSFKASVVGNYTEENQTLENVYMYKKITVVIETKDNVKELDINDIIKMKGEIYRVVDINRTTVQKQEQFLNDEYMSYITYISLRR
jgi:hypothetical protein